MVGDSTPILTGVLDAHIERMRSRLAATSALVSWLQETGGSEADIYLARADGEPASARFVVLESGDMQFEREAIGNTTDPLGWSRSVHVTLTERVSRHSQTDRARFLNETSAIFSALMATYGNYYASISVPAATDFRRDLETGESVSYYVRVIAFEEV